MSTWSTEVRFIIHVAWVLLVYYLECKSTEWLHVPPDRWRSYLDQLWDSDVMLPRVDGGHAWINYGIYTAVVCWISYWTIGERRPRVGLCFLFLLPPQSIDIPWFVFALQECVIVIQCFFSLLHPSFEAPRRRLDLPVLASSRPRVRSVPLRYRQSTSFFRFRFRHRLFHPVIFLWVLCGLLFRFLLRLV